jgi:antitoxin VapB
MMGSFMALSIKTDEADRLARELARLKGETMTEAVTIALRERLERARSTNPPAAARGAALDDLLARIRPGFDRRPVTKAEWDDASGDAD